MSHFEQYFLQSVSSSHHPYPPNSSHHKSKESPDYLLVSQVLITPMHLSKNYLASNYDRNCLQLKTHQNLKLPVLFHTVQSIQDPPLPKRPQSIGSTYLSVVHYALCSLNFFQSSKIRFFSSVLLVMLFSTKLQWSLAPHQVYFCPSFRTQLNYRVLSTKQMLRNIGCWYT